MVALIAGLFAQVTAFGASTNAFYDLTCTTIISAGKTHDTQTSAETVALLSDGTYVLTDGTNDFTGTYTASKSGIALTSDAASTTAFETDLEDTILTEVGIPGLTVSLQTPKLGKVKLKDGAPVLETATIHGKATATIDGKQRSKGFSVKQARTGWTLESGTNP
jgi:hypothetical protein